MLFRSLSVLALVLAPVALRAADDENPYKSVKVGDYVTYKLTSKLAGGTVTQTVTAKSDTEVTVKAEVSLEVGGMKVAVPAQEQKIDLTKPFDPTKVGNVAAAGAEVKAEKLKEGKEKLKIGDKEYDCTWTTYKTTAKVMNQAIEGDSKVWTAKGVPGGVVKMTSSSKFGGQTIEMEMELTETGNKK
ncbi:MAG: hypothetical protein ACKODX_21550 [Gemmata sp.]